MSVLEFCIKLYIFFVPIISFCKGDGFVEDNIFLICDISAQTQYMIFSKNIVPCEEKNNALGYYFNSWVWMLYFDIIYLKFM